SFGFICFMPFALGCVTTYYVEMRRAQRWWVWCLLPWLPLMGALVACMVMLLEGFICLVMFTPIAIVLSTVGGLAGGLAARLVRWRDARTVTVTCIALLPILTAGLEQPVLHRHDARHVANVIDIQASPEIVWRNIERVSTISKDELPTTWARRIG